jgi:hypothetical protein
MSDSVDENAVVFAFVFSSSARKAASSGQPATQKAVLLLVADCSRRNSTSKPGACIVNYSGRKILNHEIYLYFKASYVLLQPCVLFELYV